MSKRQTGKTSEKDHHKDKSVDVQGLLEKLKSEDVSICESACLSLSTVLKNDHAQEQLKEHNILEVILDLLRNLIQKLKQDVATAREQATQSVEQEMAETAERARQEAARRAKLASRRQGGDTKSEKANIPTISAEKKENLIQQRFRGLLTVDEDESQKSAALATALGAFCSVKFWSRVVRDTDAIPLLCGLLDSSAPSVLTSAVTALSAAAQDVQMRGDIALEGGLVACTHLALTQWDVILTAPTAIDGESDGDVEESAEYLFLQPALKMMARCAMDFIGRERLRPSILSLMKACQNSTAHTSLIQGALEVFCHATLDVGVRDAFVAQSGVEALAEFMRHTSGIVCTLAACTLSNLALNPKSLPIMVSANIQEALVLMLSLSHPRAQAAGASLMANFCMSPEALKSLCPQSPKIIKDLRALIMAGDPDSVRCAFDAMSRLVLEDVFVKEIQSQNILPILARAIHAPPATPREAKERGDHAQNKLPFATRAAIVRFIGVLYSLKQAEVSSALNENGVITAVCGILSEAGALSDLAIVGTASLALAAAAQHEPSRHAIRMAEGIPLLSNLIAPTTPDGLLSPALHALAAVCEGCSAACAEFVKLPNHPLPLVFQLIMDLTSETPLMHLETVRNLLRLITALASDVDVAFQITSNALFARLIDLSKLPTDRLGAYACVTLNTILSYDISAKFWFSGTLDFVDSSLLASPYQPVKVTVQAPETVTESPSTQSTRGSTAAESHATTTSTPQKPSMRRRPFYDCWRGGSSATSFGFKGLTDLTEQPVSRRHDAYALVADASPATDIALVKLIEQCQAESKELSVEEKVTLLSQTVMTAMGGSLTGENEQQWDYQSHIQELKTKVGSMVIPVGMVQRGTGRHRAFLFKVLADALSLRCTLVRSSYSFQPHAWNEVELKTDGGVTRVVVDLLSTPGTFYSVDSDEAKEYMRV